MLRQWYEIYHLFRKTWSDESGATAIEYALIAGGIAIAIIASTFAIGTTLDGIFDDVGTGFGG